MVVGQHQAAEQAADSGRTDPSVGSHRKPKGRSDGYEHSSVLRNAGTELPWTRRYPAITAAALAGTMVGGPGGVAAAMTFSTTNVSAASDTHVTVTATPIPALATVPMPSAAPTASASASPSPSARTSSSPKPTPKPTQTPPPNPYAYTTLAQLEPTALYGGQTTFVPSTAQWGNARIIVQVAEQRKMPLYAAVIAIATAMQESQLINLTTATNADSLGLFQQRPSQGWGTAAQLTDPYYSTNAFLAALDVYAPHYMTIYLWESAQAVQRPNYPTAYAQWESQAAQMVLAIVNGTAPH
jgi:hypothetical protein